MKLNKRLIVALVASMFLIPGAWAITTGGGALVSTVGGGHAEGIFASTASSTVSQASFTDADVNYNNWLDDTTGKHVEETLKVVQGSGNYKCEFKKGTTIVNPDSVNHLVPTSSSLTASQLLTVTNAKEIHAGAKARNGEGDQAGVDVNILIGSITGYKNSATATMTQATASQSASSASGNYVEFITKSNNKELDNACSSLKVQSGSVTSYASSATTTKSQAKVSQSASSATGSYVEFLTKSNNKELDNVSPSLEIGYYDNNNYGGSVTGYASSATAIKTKATASQSAMSVSGNPIIFTAWANNKERDNVSPSLKVHQGSVVGYQDSATATMTQATAGITGNGVTIPATGGTSIFASASASNGEGDMANVGITTGPIAWIKGYKDSATSTRTKATSSLYMKSAGATWFGVQGHAQNWKTAKDFKLDAQKLGITNLITEATPSSLVIRR